MSLLDELRQAGLSMLGAFPPREFETTDETGDPVTVVQQLRIGWTTDETKANAARDLGATVTFCRGSEPQWDGWEVSIREVVA